MGNFWLFIKTQKKIVLFLVLFCFLGGVFFPILASAATSTTSNQADFVDLSSAQVQGSFLFNAPRFIMLGLSYLISKTILTITQYCSNLFLFIIYQFTNSDTFAITKNEIFLAAWNMVKNWANMLIVVAIMGVAMATILRFKEYEAKKLLPSILIVALLINFSVLFCGIFIDLSNIIMINLLRGSGAEGEGNLVNTINAAWNAIVYPMPLNNLGQAMAYVGISAVFNLVYLITALALLYFMIIFIERYILLSMLFILSPLAFIFRVFPLEVTKKLWTDWWRHFIKWCFIGLGGAFFLRLSGSMLILYTARNNLAAGQNNLWSFIFYLIVVLGFLVIGIKITMKSSGPITDTVMKMGGIALGGALAIGTGGASAALKMAGSTAGGEKVKSWYNQAKDSWSDSKARAGERVGLYGAGTLEGAQQKRKQERLQPHLDAYDKIKDNSRLATEYDATASPEKKAAIAQTLIQRNALDAIDPKKHAAVAQQAIQNGVKASEFAKADPTLAGLDKNKVSEIARRENLTSKVNPLTGIHYTSTEATEAAKKTAIREAYADYKLPDYIKDMKVEDQIEIFKQNTDPITKKANAKGAKIMDYMAKEGTIGKLGKEIGGNKDLYGQLNHTAETFGSMAKKGAYKVDPRLIGYDKEAIDKKMDDLIKITPTLMKGPATEALAREQLISEGFKGLNAKEIKDMNADAFTEKFVDNTDSKKISKAKEFGLSAEKIKKLQDLLPTLRTKRATMLPGSNRKLLNQKIRAIKML